MAVANCDTGVRIPGRAIASQTTTKGLTMFDRISKVITWTLNSIQAAILFNCDPTS